MADAAAVAHQLALAQLPQRAAALGAGEARTRDRRGGSGRAGLGGIGFGAHGCLLAAAVGGAASSREQPRPSRRRARPRAVRVDRERARRHAGHQRVARGPGRSRARRPAATASAPAAPSSSAPESTTATAAAPQARGQRAEHRVRRGAHAVLLRAAAELDPVGADQQVVVGGRDVDRARLAAARRARRARPSSAAGAVEDRREQAAAGRRDVQDDADRGVEVRGQRADEPRAALRRRRPTRRRR